MEQAEVSRRSALKSFALAGLGAASVPLWVRELAAGTPSGAAVFDAHQRATVLAICERIIPETETPGAASVRVDRFIDAVVADAAPEVRRRFLEGLSWIDARSRRQYGSDFIALTSDHQVELLEPLSAGDSGEEQAGIEFFLAMKSLTVRGYYTSEAVMRGDS